MSAQRFDGRVALVTGGGSGIGRAAARAFAREGATVVVTGRNDEKLAETVELIEGEGGAASRLVADVTSAADADAMVRTTVQRHGSLDIAFNNAGVFLAGPLHEVSEADWENALSTNVTGVFLAMQREIAYMRQNGGGAIVNTSSIFGPAVRSAGTAAYGATKAAVSALTGAAAREYIADGIRINAVTYGMMDTSMSLGSGTESDRAAHARENIPRARVGTMEEAAAAVLYLASDEAGFTVGHDLVIDGGVAA